MEIQVFSDGSATTKDKPGGWGSVIIVNGSLHKELSGHLEKATNNDAELYAAIKGLDYVMELVCSNPSSFPQEHDITLISDSEIILNWANGKYKFKQVDKLPLYDHLRRLVKKLNVKTKWVKGHGTDVNNIRCDKLANNARKNILIENIDKPNKVCDTRIGTKKAGIVCLWHAGVLKIVDLENNIVENYSREVHGKRGSAIEIREEKDR
jgi:ribonuclease HI